MADYKTFMLDTLCEDYIISLYLYDDSRNRLIPTEARWSLCHNHCVVSQRLVDELKIQPVRHEAIYKNGFIMSGDIYSVNIVLPNNIWVPPKGAIIGDAGYNCDLLLGLNVVQSGILHVIPNNNKMICTFTTNDYLEAKSDATFDCPIYKYPGYENYINQKPKPEKRFKKVNMSYLNVDPKIAARLTEVDEELNSDKITYEEHQAKKQKIIDEL